MNCQKTEKNTKIINYASSQVQENTEKRTPQFFILIEKIYPVLAIESRIVHKLQF